MLKGTIFDQRYWSILVVFSLIVTLYSSNWLLPERSTLEPLVLNGGWIEGTATPLKRAYFRHTETIAFKPRQAWLAIVSEEYTLYVNGQKVAHNNSPTNPSNAIQQRLSNREQSISRGNNIPMVRTPDLQKLPSDESRLAQLVDISQFVVEGENTIAIYIQSSQSVRFAIKGEIIGDIQSQTITNSAEQWLVSPIEQAEGGILWVENNFKDEGWSTAINAGPIDQRVFTTIPMAMVSTPWQFNAVTADVAGGELNIQHSLPLALEQDGNSWLRIYCSWPYTLFIDEMYVLSGRGGDGVNAVDISTAINRGAKQISLRLERPLNITKSNPIFALDGFVAGREIATPNKWMSLKEYHSGWLEGEGDWKPLETSALTIMPKAVSFFTNESQPKSWYSSFFWLFILSIVVTSFLLWLLGKSTSLLQKTYSDHIYPSPYVLLSIPVMALFSAILIKIRLQESDGLLFFVDPVMEVFWFWLGPVMMMLALLVFLPKQTVYDATLTKLVSTVKRFDPIIWLVIIVCIGFILRVFNIGYEALQADENVSWDAARGILRTGTPESISGIYYTRSPFYHYLLAGWLWLFGDTISMARLYSVLSGVGVLVAVYYLVYFMTKRHSLALICAFLLAIDPWQINMSRNIRFYQQLQLFSVITILLFLRGFVWKHGKQYQNWFFASCLAAVLSQEVFVITFPAFCIAGLYYYRNFSWSKDRNVWIGFITMMSLTIFDMSVFSIVCLTPHVGIATSSDSIMQLHLLNVMGFYNTFLFGNTRVHMLYFILFIVGIFYWLRYPNKAIITLYVLVLLTLTTVTVLVMQIANRYVFCLYPAYIIIAVVTADKLLLSARNFIFKNDSSSVTLIHQSRWQSLMLIMLAILVVINVEPHKVLGSYESNHNPQQHHALQFIAEHRLPGDKLIAVHPMPAAIVFKKLDYYLMESISFDEIFMSDRGIIDRWSGGKLVSNVEQLNEVFIRNERVWILFDDQETPKFSKEILDFITNSTRVEHEFFGGKVYLWERSAGRLAPIHDRDGLSNSY